MADTYGSYARDQLDRVAASRQRSGQTNHKQAMRMIRLLLAGAHVLRTGEVLVGVEHLRDRLLAVRHHLPSEKAFGHRGGADCAIILKFVY